MKSCTVFGAAFLFSFFGNFEIADALSTKRLKRWRLHSFGFAFGLALCVGKQRQMCAMWVA
jgi:hypothetical protein